MTRTPLIRPFVSLGGDCQPAHHIRRLTTSQAPLIFDWLTTPLAAIVPLIQSGFADIFDPQVLAWTELPDGWTVTDSRHGLTAMHQFKSREARHVQDGIDLLRRLGEDFMETLDARESMVFVRRWGVGDIATDAEALRAYLDARCPGCTLLELKAAHDGAPGIRGRHVICHNPPTLSEWIGDDRLYEQNFELADRVAGLAEKISFDTSR